MKKFLLLYTCLVLLISLCVTAAATNDKVLIRDDAQLLTQSEIDILQEKATQISNDYSMDVLIVTVETTGSRSVETYAEDFYLNNGYGFGEDHSGFVFLIAMDEREWTVRTFGEGRNALSDSQIANLMSGIITPLSNDKYYMAFYGFLIDLEVEIKDYMETSTDEILIPVLIVLGIGLLAGFITITVMKRDMKTAVFQHGARDYVVSDSYRLHQQRDIYLYSHVTKVRRSSDSSSGSNRGGSGRSGGSSGRF